MPATHSGEIRFIGESGKEAAMYETPLPVATSYANGYKLLHTSGTLFSASSVGSTVTYEYGTQVGDGENWVS